MTQQTKEPVSAKESIRQTRIQKLAELADKGINPYPYAFDKDADAKDLQEKYKDLPAGEETEDFYSVAGRVMAIRNSGMFIDLMDTTGKIQIFSHKASSQSPGSSGDQYCSHMLPPVCRLMRLSFSLFGIFQASGRSGPKPAVRVPRRFPLTPQRQPSHRNLSHFPRRPLPSLPWQAGVPGRDSLPTWQEKDRWYNNNCWEAAPLSPSLDRLPSEGRAAPF